LTCAAAEQLGGGGVTDPVLGAAARSASGADIKKMINPRYKMVTVAVPIRIDQECRVPVLRNSPARYAAAIQPGV
jgi:hypothetical protein